MTPLYLDNAASTPLDLRVWDVMTAFVRTDAGTGNPSASHYAGCAAAQAIEHAAEQLAGLIKCPPKAIHWTSGATQSIDWALQSHIITLATEHQAVLQACERLMTRGMSVTVLQPGPEGRVNLQALAEAIRPETRIISIMHVNNETGLIQDISAIGALARQAGVLFHVDATQSVGKLPLDMANMPIDLMSGSAHKFHGPKGIGFLYVRPGTGVILPTLGGTLPSHQIVGLGEAAALAHGCMASEYERITQLNTQLWGGLADLPGIYRLGHPQSTSPYILNLGFLGIPAQLWMETLPHIAFSAGSACNSSSLSSSYVLKSLGLSEAQAKASLRFSFGRFTTSKNIDQAIRELRAAYEQLRSSHQWWV